MSHDWLWALNPAHGPIVPPEDFSTCVRLRIGAFSCARPCERCGTELSAAHCLCCAAPEGTKGHYAVRDSILPLVHLADPSAALEAPELIPTAPALRPADIYSESALPGGRAALDVGICSPDAMGAGADCCDAMWEKKQRRYAEYRDDMAHQGLVYVPLVFSCCGRVHGEATAAIVHIAQQAARRQGLSDHRPLLRRTMAGIGVAIWRRAAAMAKACMPRLSHEGLQLLFGDVDSTAGDSEATPGCALPTSHPDRIVRGADDAARAGMLLVE